MYEYPGGGAHRLMRSSSPDMDGPFTPYYTAWFGHSSGVATDPVLKTSPRVCYSEVYFQPFPGTDCVVWSRVSTLFTYFVVENYLFC